MFTDGFYDLGVRTTAAERKQFGDTKFYAPGLLLNDQATVTKIADLGVHALCDKGGVADQLREDQITTLAVALTSNMRPSDQAFLQAVVSGKGPKKTCGSRNGSRSGVFLPAFNPAALIGTFDTIATRIAGGSPVGPLVSRSTPVRHRSPAPAATTELHGRSDSLRRVHLFVSVLQRPIDRSCSSRPVASAATDDPGAARTRIPELRWTAPRSPVPGRSPRPQRSTSPSTSELHRALLDGDAARPRPARPRPARCRCTPSPPNLAARRWSPPRRRCRPVSRPRACGRAGDAPWQTGKRRCHADLRSAAIVAEITDPITGKVIQLPMVANRKQFGILYTPSSTLTTSVLQVVLRLTAVTRDGVKISVSSGPARPRPTLKPS